MIGLGYLVIKTERAQVHLAAFNQELDAYCKNSHTVTTREEKGRYIRRTEWKGFPPILGMLLGEFLYCLRSGLDQLAWQLALPNSRKNHAKEISFPIVEAVTNSKQQKNWVSIVRHFPSEVAKEIEGLQPYRATGSPQDHPLWQLNKLCNIDKHCIIPINSRTLEIFVPHSPAVLVQHFDNEDAIEVSLPLKDKHQLDFEVNADMQIEFGEWNTDLRIPRHRLADILSYFQQTVIPTFRRFIFKDVATPELRLEPGRVIYAKDSVAG